MAQRSAARAAPWRSLSMHFANSQMQPLLLLRRSRYLCLAKESESESESGGAAAAAPPPAALAPSLTPLGAGGGRGALKRFLASQSFLLLCEFCAKVHQGGGHDGKPSTAAVLPPCRQAKRQLSAEMARIAILGPARICNVLRALHSAKHSDNSPSLRRSTVTCN